jgi:hypothetical protein
MLPVAEAIRRTPRVPTLDAWLVDRVASGLDVAWDDELGATASACSIGQLLGYVSSAPELPAEVRAQATHRLAAVLKNAVGSDGRFPLPYNRVPGDIDWWDIAEVGAAAPALLVAANSGVESARAALLRGAEFVLTKEREDLPGSFVKNVDTVDADIPNANAYTAVTLACAAEASGDPSWSAQVDPAVERLISQFGVSLAGWWPYRIGLGANSPSGVSLAYQATIVGCGLFTLPCVGPGLQDRFAGVLLAASRQVEAAYESAFTEELEEPAWARDWAQIPEIAWALRRASPAQSADDPAVVHLQSIDPLKSSRTMTSRAGRTPVTTTLRKLANLAGAAVMLGLTEQSSLAAHADHVLEGAEADTGYVQRFGEPAARVVTGRWEFGRAERTMALPNRVTVKLPANAEHWLQTDFEQPQSTLLWLHSLGFAPSLIQREDSITDVLRVLDSYWAFTVSARSQHVRSFMTSYDHCVAVRVRTLCMVAAILKSRDHAVPRSLVRIVANDLEWARDPENVKPNNPGMMLCAAVLHAAVVFPGLVGSESELARTAEGNLIRIILGAFDESGVCLENTPSYHAFYLRFMRELLSFATEYRPDGSLHSTLTPLVDNATKALELLVWHDGTLPPIGDSGAERTSLESRNGTLFAPDAGFYVRKSSNAYFSIRSGYSSSVHKHCDDTAITLRVGDRTLLLDGGMFNYDWQDERTVAVKSQRGHSGVFFERYDQFYPAALYRPGAERVRSRMEREQRRVDEDLIKCWAQYDGTHTVERVVRVTDGALSIEDRFESPGDDHALQRFLVPLDASIEMSSGCIRLDTEGGAWMEIDYDAARPVREFCGMRNPMRGWVSTAWNKIECCRAIEILPRKHWSTMRAEIRYGVAS